MVGGGWLAWLAAAAVMGMVVILLVVGWARACIGVVGLVIDTVVPNVRGAVDGVDEDGGRLAARGGVVAVDDVVNPVEALPSGEAEAVDRTRARRAW